MKKVLFEFEKFIAKFLWGGVIALFVCGVLSCDVGLGESVDSESPSVAISYPPEQAVIRGTFIAAGSCNDDKGVKSVKVTIYSPSDETLSFGPYEASISNGKTWQINLNEYDEEKYANYNGWQIPDGTYTIKVNVEDNAGRTQETPATQTVDIDNTAPIFIVSAPGKKYSSDRTFYKYGSAFTVSGTIAEKHKPDLTVNVYNENSSENPITFTEKEVDTSGTSSIEFARYIKNSTSQKVVNYEDIYKDEITDASSTKNFKLSALLTDNAKQYINPSEKTNTTTGNTTTKVFIYDEVYSTYQSAQIGLGLTAEDFKNILNGTKTGTISGQGKTTGTCEEVRTSLNKLFVDTTQTNLAFSLNPNANPTYSISGFVLSGKDFTSDSFTSNASKGSNITAVVNCGENGTNIVPSSLKMWLYNLDSTKTSYTSDEISEEVRKLEDAVYNGTSSIVKDSNGISTLLGWTLVDSNENSTDSSATTYSYSGKIPIAMKQGGLYLLVVTGTDADSAYLSQETVFGFKGVVSGTPPTLSFENVTDQSYFATSDEISFDVITKSEEVELTKILATVTVKDESTGKSIGETYTEEKALSGNSDTWNFKLSDVSNYSNVNLTNECGKSYLYTIKFTAENISGSYSESLNLHVDAIKPQVNISSVTPYVNGSDRTDISGIDENKDYLNGTITVSGSVVESNLKDVSYKVYIGDNTTEVASGSLGSVYQYQIPIDTTQFSDSDGKNIKVEIIATDNVGNTGSYDTTLYNDSDGPFVILQETDKPQVTLKNADSTGTDSNSILDENRFTNASSNKIQAEIKDDDGIARVIVTVYKKDGKTVVSEPTTIYEKESNYKTSYNLNYELPTEKKDGATVAKEGIYGIKIEVQDSTYKNSSDTLRTTTAGIFYIGVDTSDPTITETKIGESGLTTNKNTVELSGSASDTNGIQSVKIVDTSKNNAETTATYSSNSWSCNLENLSDGLHALQITATDTTGRSKTITRNVTIDTNAPTIQKNNEKELVFLDQTAYITLTATASDAKKDDFSSGVANAFVYINNTGSSSAPTYSESDSKWVAMSKTASGYTATLNLANSTYNITNDKTVYAWFAATDNAGNSSVSTSATEIVCDANAPVISEVKNGETKLLSGGTLKSNSEEINLTVTVTDTNVKGITVVSTDGVVSTGSTTGSSGSSTSTSGATIENGVTITKNSTTESETIYNVTYTINSDGSDSSVVFKATDENKRESEKFTIIAKCDKTAPTVEITNPSSEQIQTTSLTVNGNYTEENLESIEVTLTPIDANGNEDSSRSTQTAEASVSVGTSSGSGTWNAKFYELTEGSYKITVSALDEYSNFGSAEKTFTLDVTAPTLSVTTYPTAATKEPFTLSGSVSDTYLYSVVVTDSLDSTKSWEVSTGSTTASSGLTNSTTAQTWSLELTPSAAGTGSDSNKNYVKDGKHTFTVTAKDKAGNVSTQTVQVTTDVTNPTWATTQKDTSSKETSPYIRNAGITATVNSAETTVYNSTNLTFVAKATDLTSGIKELVYKVDSEDEKSTENANFTLEFKNGSHTVTLKALDEAGNESTSMSWMFFVDSYAPSTATLTSVDSDSADDVASYIAQKSRKLVNGNSDVTFTLSASDYGEDVGSTGSSSGTSSSTSASGIASVALTKIGNTTLSSAINGVVSTGLTTEIKTYSITIPKENLSSGAVTVKVTDNAGNSSEFALFNLLLDNDPPSVKLNSPTDADSLTKDKIDVNGTITLSGTVNDGNGLSSSPIDVQYNTTSSTATEGWTTLESTYESTTSSYSATLNTTTFTDKSNVYIRATGTDSAGNTSTTDVLTLYVNQNTDRPVIQITNIDDSSSWLTTKTLRGTITDDDGIQSFQISEDGTTYSAVTVTNGSWSYDITSGDGEGKTIYFKVTDTAGTTFTTGAVSTSSTTVGKTPYYLFVKTTSSDSGYSDYGFESNSALSLKLDTESPLLGTSGLDIKTTHDSLAETSKVVSSASTTTTSGSTTAGVASGYEISASRYAGGNSKYIKFYVPAYDANISGVTITISNGSSDETSSYKTVNSTGSTTDGSASIELSATTTTLTVTSTTYTYYESSPILVSEATTGQKTVAITVLDKAGNTKTSTESFYIDNIVGEDSITITSPDSTTEVTGTVNVVGTATDVGIGLESIEWLIPPKNASNKSDTELSELEGWTSSNNVRATAVWNFQFLAGGQYDLTNYDDTTNYDVTHNEETNIYTIPLYLKATDKLGNVYIKKDFYLTHNPDADRPVTEISYPTSNDYDSGESYITLSGTIRVNGTVQIPSGTTDVGKVFVQIGTVGTDGTIDWSSSNSTFAKEFATLGGIVTPTANSDGTYSITDSSSGTTYGTTTYVTSDWWGIPCTTKTSTWNISLNTSGDLNPSDSNGTTNIAVRACAINEDGKMGLWTTAKTSAPVIHVDQNAPSQTAVMRQYSEFNSSSLDSNVSVQKDYVSEMYLKGTWYLTVTLSDNDSLDESSISVKRGSSKISDWEKSEQSTGTDTRIYRTIYIPIDTTSISSSSVNYTVYVEDSSGHSSTNVYTFYIDNTAPTFDTLTGNSVSLLDSTVPVVQNSNYAYTLAGSMTEAGSGLERVFFYFLRQDGTDTTGSTKRVLDAVKTYSTYSSDSTDFYVSSLKSYTLTQGSDTFTMYGKTYSGSLDENRTTFTISDSSYSSNVHIREGGLIYIGGEYHKITKVDSSAITFEDEVPSSVTVTVAGFPYGQVVDCTEKATFDSASNKYVITSDDGDEMPETMTKVATTYNWDGTIYSDVMPDGPCQIVLIAFDKAGNVSGKTISTSIQNNAPRIAKLHLGTDLSGDGTYSENEFNTYSFISGDAKQDLFQSSVDFATSGTNYASYGKPFKITSGLAVVPEFTGGNGDIYMKFLADASSSTGYQTKSGDSDSAFYAAESDTTKVTATFDVNKNTTTGTDNTTKAFVVNDTNLTSLTDGTGKAMSFTFWDSTDGTTCGTDSNYCFVRVSDFTLALKDGVAPTTVVNPFYWNSSSDNSLYKNSSANGHIELEADLPETFTESGSGENDRDPKVSGKVTLTGYAYDDQRLGKISVQFTDGLLSSETDVATYSSGTWTVSSATMDSNGYEFTVSTSEDDGAYFNQNGHKVFWTLSLNTEKITGSANADVSVTVKATDAKGSNETSTTNIVAATTDSEGNRTIVDGTTNYPIYKMDVVPYITKVTTYLSNMSKSNTSVYNRNSTGNYSVRAGETITVAGFNIIGGTSTATINGTSVTLTSSNQIEISSSGVTSGGLVVTTNNVSSLNNSNNNDSVGSYTGTTTSSTGDYDIYTNWYNRQPNNINNNVLNDDVVLDVWDIQTAVTPISGTIKYPNMKINPATGMPGFSFANAVLYFNMPGTVNGGSTKYSQMMMESCNGGFTNNNFTWDSNGNAYGAALGTDTGWPLQGASFQIFSRESPNAVGVQQSYMNQKNANRLESINICLSDSNANTTDSTKYSTDTDRITSPALSASVYNNVTTLHVAYYDRQTQQIRYRYGTISSANAYNGGSLADYAYSNFATDGTAWAAPPDSIDADGSSYVYTSNENGVGTKTSKSGTGNSRIEVVANNPLASGRTAYTTAVNSAAGAGEYLDMGLINADTSTPIVVIAWYDSANSQLVLSYEDPTSSSLPTTALESGTVEYAGLWQNNATVVESEAGQHVQLRVDPNNGVHLAYYANGDLHYAFYRWTGSSLEKVVSGMVVDSYQTVGAKCTIGVTRVARTDVSGAYNYVPYIGYQMNVNYAKVAYPVKFVVSSADSTIYYAAGAGAVDDMYTGNWATELVPTKNTPIDYKVSADVYTSGTNKVQTAIPAISSPATRTMNNVTGYAVCNASQIGGNGTSNPIVSYAVSENGALEMAQKK